MPRNSAEEYWLPAYLFYGEPWEQLLTEAVEPFVEKVFQNDWADQYFFIRYWEKGPHIRLRFKGDREVLQQRLRPQLESHFTRYFESFPSTREEPQWEEVAEEFRWFPNNSLQFIEYEPEVKRYGGPVGILIAERQFELSSRAIVRIIRDCPQWRYDRALGAGIQMHLSFARAMDMGLTEARHFFNRIFENWFGWGLGFYPNQQNRSGKEIRKQREETLNAFADQFDIQKGQLIPFHQVMWDALEQEVLFDQEWLNDWITGMESIGKELYKEQLARRLTFPIDQWVDQQIDVPADRQIMWSILFSYIHMTNNRLGILNRDEAYLGYLIKESLSAMDGKHITVK